MMTPKEKTGTLACLDRYTKLCEDVGIIPMREEVWQVGINHAYWMIETLQKEIVADNPLYDDGKVGRWLGFIQCEMINGGRTTVQDERDFSRQYFKQTEPETLEDYLASVERELVKRFDINRRMVSDMFCYFIELIDEQDD